MAFLKNIKEVLNTDVFDLVKKPKTTNSPSVDTTTEAVSRDVSQVINLGYTQEQINSYFNPVTSDAADNNSLAKIIQGQILNPFKLKDPKSDTDCMFFVAGNGWNSNNLDSAFNEKSPEDLYRCEWFGLFTANRNSKIVIPNKIVIDMSADRQIIDVDIVDKNVWGLDGGFFQFDKNIKKKIIKSNIDDSTMRQIIKKIHGDVMFL